MAQMMFAKQQPTRVEISGEFLKLVAQQVLLKQFLLQPERDRHLEGAESARGKRDVGLQQPLEFEERLVVEHDVIELVGRNAGFCKAIGDGVVRKRGVMLSAGKTLLLRGGDDPAVIDQRCRAVMIECGNTEDPHRAV